MCVFLCIGIHSCSNLALSDFFGGGQKIGKGYIIAAKVSISGYEI